MARRKKCLLVPIHVCEIDKTVEWDYDKTAEEILTQFLVCFLRKQTILERKTLAKKSKLFFTFSLFCTICGGGSLTMLAHNFRNFQKDNY